jgi:chromate transport protein ChrA
VAYHQGESQPLSYRLWELVKHILPAGCYAFGGPTAHLAVFHDLFVEKLRWLNDQVSLRVWVGCLI